MKDYDKDPVAKPQETFTLRGVKFTLMGGMPPSAFDDLAEIQSGAYPARPFHAYSHIIWRCLVTEDRERWDAFLLGEEAAGIPVELATLAEIADDIVGVTMNRPPTQSSPSGTTGASTQNGSTDDSGSQEAKASTTSLRAPV